MENEDELKQMIYSFRITELHSLLGFAGRSKVGRKVELQQRAIDLLSLKTAPVHYKIKKLNESLLQSLANPFADSSFNAPSVTITPAAAPALLPVPAPAAPVQTAVAPATSAAKAMQPHNNRVYPTYPPGHPANRSQAAMYNPNMYQAGHHQANHQYAAPTKPLQMPSQYPVHPDVKFKRLPFYDHIGELIKPSSLVPQGTQRQQEGTFMFHFTPAQADMIGTSRDIRPGSRVDYTTQVQLRFCLLETTSEQEDCFPPGINVKVNQKVCSLPNPIPPNKPGVEPKRPPRPVNITQLVKISPVVANAIHVAWNTDYTRGYVLAVHLVEKKTSDDLLNRLKAKGVRAADYTRGMIKDKLKEDGEIATTSLRVSLACPLGKMRMATPCRASTCGHFQCFDASLYLQMNEKKPGWVCPVCHKPAVYDKLVIDGYFQEMLESAALPPECTEIELHMNGSWSPFVVCKKEQSMVVDKAETPVKAEPVKVEPAVAPISRDEKPDDVTIVTLSDSDDEPLMPRKRPELDATVPDIAPTYHEPHKAAPVQPRQHSPSLIILDEDSPEGSPSTQQPPAPQFHANTNGRSFSNYVPPTHNMDIHNIPRYPY